MKNCTQLFSSYYTVASLAAHLMSEIKRYALFRRPSKIQISLRIHTIWSESSAVALWVAKGPMFLQTENYGSDQTVQMSRLIWIW